MSTSQLDSLISNFDGISLEEMDNVRLMNRQDTKFVLHFDQFLPILRDLIQDYRILEIDNERLFTYDSVYFDEANLSLYKDHHRRKKDRFKVRYRKYKNSGLAFLEVKHKTKGRTEKSRIAVDDLHHELSKDHQEFVAGTGMEAAHLEAILSNRFQRMTLVGKAHNERLTIDFNLSFKQDEVIKTLPHIVIAELKQEKLTRNSPFFSIMKKELIRPFRISKYCIGVIELMGTEAIKYNRFKKKLLYLSKLIRNNAA